MPDRIFGMLAACAGLLSAPSTLHAAVGPARIEVEPAEVRLIGARDRQQVAVTAIAADGSVRDVTAEARFAIEPSGPAEVSASGVVTPRSDGEALLRIEATGLSAEVAIRVEAADLTPPVGYRSEVAAWLTKSGCNMGACHGNLNGKGGFRLSLRGEDPSADLLSISRDAFGRRLALAEPGSSLVVLKPTGALPHEGGIRFPVGSPEARELTAWIAAGAVDDISSAPKLVRLSVFPEYRAAAAPSLAQQLVVRAEFADGSSRDVTRMASYDVPDPTRAAVSAEGRASVAAPGEVVVAVRYLGGRAVSRLAFLADRPDFAWAGPAERNAIDRAAFAKLRSLKINPSPPASDAAFLRRAFLDAIGVLPDADEARAFLADRDPEKRRKAVDRLVRRPEFADFWALKWADLLRNEEKSMGDKGVWIFQRWLRDAIDADLPMDEFARRLVASTGSTYRDPAASFHRTNRDPSTAAETVAQVFLGLRLQCARCHNHPNDVWTQDDYYGLAAYFGNVQRKFIADGRTDKFDKHEIFGDEFIYVEGRPEMVQPRSGLTLAPKPPSGPKPDLGDDPNALDDLANWLTGPGNDQFARNLANRVWFHLLGRGVVEPVDDFRDSNPPSDPALLDALTAELRSGGMRLRPLVAFIMDSATYGLDAKPNPTNADDSANFARAQVRLLPAEVLLDAIGRALDAPDAFENAPPTARAGQLAGARMGGTFLKAFGKPDRLLTCECERSEATTLAQAFQLINGQAVRSKLEAPDNRIGRLLKAGLDDPAILDDLAYACAGEPPTGEARIALLAHVAEAADRRKAWEDVAWAFINSKEFLLRH